MLLGEKNGRKLSLNCERKKGVDYDSKSQILNAKQLKNNSVREGKLSNKKDSMQQNSIYPGRKLSLNLQQKAGAKNDRKTSLPQSPIKKREFSLGQIQEVTPGQNEANGEVPKSGLDNGLFDDLFSTDRGSVSSGYHSTHQNEENSDEVLNGKNLTTIDNIFEHDSSDESSEPDENRQDAEPEFEGECALDMFIDPLNPFGKAVHSTLQSKINDQKEKEEDLKKTRAKRRADKLKQMQLEKEQRKREKELDKLKRRLENVHLRKQQQQKRTDDLNERSVLTKEREANYYRRYEVWKDKMENLYQEQLEVTLPLEEECSNMRAELYSHQKSRMEAFKAKMDPIIIREGPSKSANYKMQAKYLQYEIYPLTQRFRITQMRADGEEMKRRGVEKEVWQLRDKISDYNAKISVATKGVPISKTMLSKISDHNKKWKELCNSVKIAKELSQNKRKQSMI